MKTKTMNVTAEVKKLFNDEGKAKAMLSLNFDGLLVVRGARLVDGAKGMFLSMPSRKTEDGEYKAICFPINDDFRIKILDTAIAAYEKALAAQDAADEAEDAVNDGDTGDAA